VSFFICAVRECAGSGVSKNSFESVATLGLDSSTSRTPIALLSSNGLDPQCRLAWSLVPCGNHHVSRAFEPVLHSDLRSGCVNH